LTKFLEEKKTNVKKFLIRCMEEIEKGGIVFTLFYC